VFKVMTWTLESLFRPGTEGGLDLDAVYEAKLNGLASTIDQCPGPRHIVSAGSGRPEDILQFPDDLQPVKVDDDGVDSAPRYARSRTSVNLRPPRSPRRLRYLGSSSTDRSASERRSVARV
jgi:hypothetical protein